MKDKIIRGTTKDKHIRFFAVNATETARYASDIHKLSTTNSVIMGRMLSAALMLGFDLKSDRNLVTLKIDCDGPIGGSIVTATRNGNVKGYIKQPQLEIPLNPITKKINVQGAIGSGYLTIIKDLGLKNPYVGQVELLYSTIAQDLTYYFVKSEQTPTSIGLGVLIEPGGKIRQAGGFMVQLMPDTPEEIISKLEDNLAKFPNMTDVMDMGYSIEEIIDKFILKDMHARILQTIPAEYKCNCNYERMREGIKLLTKEELQESIEKGENIVTQCHFCNREYVFNPEQISEILAEM